MRLVTYIHQNPQKHKFVEDYREWPYSSYHIIASSEPTFLKRQEVLDWFGGINSFEDAHRVEVEIKVITPLIMDDPD